MFSKTKKKAAIFVAFFITLISCNSVDIRTNKANAIAKKNEYQPAIEPTKKFPIQTFVKNHNSTHAVIYLEGDGLVLTSSGVAFNPTPTDPMALRLASVDSRSYTKIVINRPCQYITCKACDNKYWTQARYSTDVIASIIETIHKLQAKYNFKTFDIIAYSGGAAIAFLIAHDFKDQIKSITTFAGNVDPFAWCEYHGNSPLTQSLNPLDNIDILRTIPQKHFCGTSDHNTTIAITQDFQKKLNSNNIEVIIVEGYDHDSNWPNYWKKSIDEIKVAVFDKTDYNA